MQILKPVVAVSLTDADLQDHPTALKTRGQVHNLFEWL
ncbi:hypothetical protein A1S_3633 [Acinetobacter baumannii ATCC 17978]|nr:hypothetical protein A1S_3633 [Acinetobacter baumannii ATCC 17978]